MKKFLATFLFLITPVFAGGNLSSPVPQTRTIEERIIHGQLQELDLSITRLNFKKKNYPNQWTATDQALLEALSERYFTLSRELVTIKMINNAVRSVQSDRVNKIKERE